jgi:hypothetical protein
MHDVISLLVRKLFAHKISANVLKVGEGSRTCACAVSCHQLWHVYRWCWCPSRRGLLMCSHHRRRCRVRQEPTVLHANVPSLVLQGIGDIICGILHPRIHMYKNVQPWCRKAAVQVRSKALDTVIDGVRFVWDPKGNLHGRNIADSV